MKISLQTWKTVFYFKTLSGKTYPARTTSLYFQDPALEKEYKLYLMRKWYVSFRTVSYLVPIWSAFLLVLFKALAYFDPYGPLVYYIPIGATIWGLICVAIVRNVSQDRLLEYLELLSVLSTIMYVDWTIGVLSAYFNTTAPPDVTIVTTIEWLCTLSTTFAVTLRRRVPMTMFSIGFTLVWDILMGLAVKRFTIGYYLEHNFAALLTVTLTIFLFVYNAEYAQRFTYLSEREYESWKLVVDDLKFDKMIGSGTYGEVFLGTWKDYKVAIKKIIPKKDRSMSTASSPTERKSTVSMRGSNSMDSDGKILTRVISKIKVMTRSFGKKHSSGSEVDDEDSRLVFEKFEQEIRLMCSLRHPNIVTFMGAYLKKPDMLLVTEFCENGSLFDFLASTTKVLDLNRKMDFSLGIAHGLQYLHTQNPPILHRDFKSLNILIDVHFTVKVCDFGLCDFANDLQREMSRKKKKLKDQKKNGKEPKQQQEKDKLVGTIPWVAPEVFEKNGHTEKSDIFSLAVVLWEIFSEKRPYMEELENQEYTVQTLVQAIVKKDLRPRIRKFLDISYYPPEAVDMIRRCWQKDPNERPSWGEIFGGLEMAKQAAKKHQNGGIIRDRLESATTSVRGPAELSETPSSPDRGLRKAPGRSNDEKRLSRDSGGSSSRVSFRHEFKEKEKMPEGIYHSKVLELPTTISERAETAPAGSTNSGTEAIVPIRIEAKSEEISDSSKTSVERIQGVPRVKTRQISESKNASQKISKSNTGSSSIEQQEIAARVMTESRSSSFDLTQTTQGVNPEPKAEQT